MSSMKKLIVASSNPVKLRAALQGFQRMFPGESFQVYSVNTASGVPDQPFGDQETVQGATNRASNAQKNQPDGDYWVGIEGGVEDFGGELVAFAWVVVQSQDGQGRGRTGAFFLPPQVSALVRQGVELGVADDLVFGKANSKQDNGAVGLLTGDVIDRASLYAHAVVLALIPFKNNSLYGV
jgi:inosine/xanthosine triphosphatase